MTTENQKLTTLMLNQTKGMEREAAIAHIVAQGMISVRRCEQFAIRTEVDRVVRQGAGRCEAMESAAITLHCSYAKVREAVYYKPKN